MADAVKIYDANQVAVVFGAVLVTSGFADGAFVKITKMSPDFTTVEGTDGQVTRSKTLSQRYKISIITMQSSSANILLSAIRNLDITSPNGAGIFPVAIRDNGGTSLFVGTKCWITGPPEVTYDRGATSREWPLECADGVQVDGGN